MFNETLQGNVPFMTTRGSVQRDVPGTQAAASPSPLPYSQRLSLSPGIRQVKFC